MTDEIFDVAVVGAGPAGLSAAVAAGEHGLRVALVDASPRLGGQFWRHGPDGETGDAPSGQHGWKQFLALRERLRSLVSRGRVVHVASHRVWFLERGDAASGEHTLWLTSAADDGGDHRESVRADSLILCTGGYDRQLPLPGWDLPGVMAAGGVQALLKEHHTLAGRRAVVAGTGPFLLPVATALARAGATVVAVCEANHPSGWLRTPIGTLAVPGKTVEAVEYAAALARHRVRYRPRTAVTAVRGESRVRAVTVSRIDNGGRRVGTVGELDCDLVALGWGFTPSLELAIAAGAATKLDVDGSLVACVDPHQRSTVSGVYLAGEVTGVGGAALAADEGEIAGHAVAADRGFTVDRRRLRQLQWNVRRHREFARAMHRAHPVPSQWPSWLSDETTVCRCEEVTWGELRGIRDQLVATDARTLKLLARPGMGWCQGRVCGYATAHLAAAGAQRDVVADDLVAMAKRSLCAPITLGELAGEAGGPAR